MQLIIYAKLLWSFVLKLSAAIVVEVSVVIAVVVVVK